MPEDRSKVGTVEVEVETSRGREVRTGYDLNDVLVQILRDLQASAGWSETELAKRVGMSQQNLNDLLGGRKKRGTSLRTLSQLCAALKLDPVRFFGSHELYREENRATRKFLEDAVYDRFRTALTLEQARFLLGVLDAAAKKGLSIDKLLEAVATLTGLPAKEKPAEPESNAM